MGRKRRKGHSRKRRRLIGLGIFGMLLAGGLVFGIVFYTANVEVVGNSRYTEQEIKNMVMEGPLSWNTLLMAKFKEHIDLSGIAFMDSVDVEYLNHNTIRLHVSEKYPIGYVEYEGSKYFFDKDGRILESEEISGDADEQSPKQTDGEQPLNPEEVAEENSNQFHPKLEDVPLVTGLEFSSASVGEQLEVPDNGIFNSILGLARMFDKYDIEPDRVEVVNNEEMILHYNTVRFALGKDENLEDKMTRVAGILPKLEGESGVLHLEAFTKDTQNIIFERDS